jgi:hypothetical protein
VSRQGDLPRFYEILSRLEQRLGSPLTLEKCRGRLSWPVRGIYFFFEEGELRSGSGRGARLVRVGTHALKESSATSLWNRLSQHRGVARSEGGNHRGSIFRLLVGAALKDKDHSNEPASWGIGGDPGKAAEQLGVSRAEVVEAERALEVRVSRYIGQMPFLFLAVEDDPGPNSERGIIERNSIALLSNFGREPVDVPSESWLGRLCDRPRVRESGLWNNNHVDERHDPAFLEMLSRCVEQTRPIREA